MKTNRTLHSRPAVLAFEDRHGSTLVVVIALLGALLLLGMLALTLSSQEGTNAEYFADSAKDPLPDSDANSYFDFALRQLILGPAQSETQSALYGGRWSLLPNMFGADLIPFNGRGVYPVWNGTTTALDLNLDGNPDAGSNTSPWLDINDSPAAQGGKPVLTGYPTPDVGYTYPDINSVFIQYDALAPVDTSVGFPVRCILPSFHRPQYLRGLGVAATDWYTDPKTTKRVLRPHSEHVAVDDLGNITAIKRFYKLDADAQADGLSAAFPFATGAQGVWTLDVVYSTGTATYTGYDVDADGDGVKDAVYLDLGFPAEAVAGGKFRIPLVAMTVKDADALFNLNAHGNVYGSSGPGALSQNPYGGARMNPGTDSILGTADDFVASPANVEFISRSNLGTMPYEVNGQYGMHATPFDSSSPKYSTQNPHNYFFGHYPDPSYPVELANMEWWFLMMGVPVYGSSATDIKDLVQGRYSGPSERNQLMAAATASPKVPSQFPLPGVSGVDDNRNQQEGLGNYFPLDLEGTGQWVRRGSYGRQKLTVQYGQNLYQRFDNYGVNQANIYYQLGLSVPKFNNYLMPRAGVWYPIDEPIETKLDPTLGYDPSDAIFDPSEAAVLQMSLAERASAAVTGRVDKLAPVNFKEAVDAESIAKLYSPVSNDLKVFNKIYDPNALGVADLRRGWEFAANPAFGNRFVFPPAVPAPNFNGSAQQPFRQALRDLLLVDPTNSNYPKTPMARFSINHVVEYGPNGRLRFRPLAAHPASLSAGVVAANSQMASRPANQQIPEYAQTVADREWLARRDRQLLCRDIYVMLYTLCGGNDNLNYLTTSNSAEGVYGYTQTDGTPPTKVDKGDQCAMMAQFAVNLVDQLDGDDIITAFEYDVDLSDGWGLGDDPFSTSDDTPEQSTQRRVVYGVEEQQLTFSEAKVIWATRAKNAVSMPADNPATQWDDTNTKNWLFFELQNVSPRSVDLRGQAWQVAVLPQVFGVRGGPLTKDPLGKGATITGEERRVTFANGTVTSGTNSPGAGDLGPVFSIMTDSDADLDTTTNTLRPTGFIVNPHYGHPNAAVDTGTKYTLAPRSDSGAIGSTLEGSKIDLILKGGDYTMVKSPLSGTDGVVATAAGNPGSVELLKIDTAGDPDAIDASYNGNLLVTLELRRRLNPYRGVPADPSNPTLYQQQGQDNPWVVVDTMTVPLQVFQIMSTDNYTNIRPQLQKVFSKERSEPLDRSQTNNFTMAAGLFNPALKTDPLKPGEDDWQMYVLDSLGMRNFATTASYSPASFAVNQFRYDRLFASTAELFRVPLYGPADLTKRVASQQSAVSPVPVQSYSASLPDIRNMTAGMMFLNPTPTDPNTSTLYTDANYSNRWHRLLEFIEIPSRWHQHFNNPASYIDAGGFNANPLGLYRVPGRINLNMLRNPEVLAGMLDDRDVLDLTSNQVIPFLLDNVENGNGGYSKRDWWSQFLWARDGIDPTNATPIMLPGLPPYYGNDLNHNGTLETTEDATAVPGQPPSPSYRQGGRPFLSAQSTTAGVGSLEDTIYRGLPDDRSKGYTDSRRLFEIGARTAAGTLEQVDNDVKHRMLAKVANNSTLRSNTFFVFIQVDFFEASEQTSPASSAAKVYRIGAKRSDPSYRGFFVIDRTRALDLLKATNLPNVTGTGNYSFDQSFNFRNLILHSRTIQ